MSECYYNVWLQRFVGRNTPINISVLPESALHLLRTLPLIHLSRARRKSLGFVVLDNLSGLSFPELQNKSVHANGYRMRHIISNLLIEVILHLLLRLRGPEIEIASLNLRHLPLQQNDGLTGCSNTLSSFPLRLYVVM